MARYRSNPLSPLRIVVAIAVAFPLQLLVGFPCPWYVTVLIGAVAIGTGRLADLLYHAVRGPTGPRGRGAETGTGCP
jgi:hypothetical protein